MSGPVRIVRTGPAETSVVLCLTPGNELAGWSVRLMRSRQFIVLSTDSLERAVAVARSCRPDLLVLGPGGSESGGSTGLPSDWRTSPICRVPVVRAGTSDSPHLTPGLWAEPEDVLPVDLDTASTAVRLRAVLRRERPQSLTARMVWADLEIRQDERRVLAAGNPVHLSFHAFNLLALLMEEPGRLWPREELRVGLLGIRTATDPKSLNRSL